MWPPGLARGPHSSTGTTGCFQMHRSPTFDVLIRSTEQLKITPWQWGDTPGGDLTGMLGEKPPEDFACYSPGHM